VSKWIPDFPRGDKITISHLLNHRAGIAHRVTTTEQESQPLSAAEMVERVEHSELLFEPGERSIYSSAGFSVLARIVELIEGRPYGEVLEQRIFRRAGMEHSVDPGFHRLVPDRATSYTPAVGGVLNTDLKDLSFLVGAGSVYSTAGDLHRLIGAVLSGTLGQAAQIALMRDEGLRWNGVTNGYRAFADYYKDTGLEVIFTGNLHTGAVDRLREDLPKIVAGEAVAPPVVPRVEAVRVDERVLRRYEGRYESERGQSFSMHVRGGELFAGDRLLVPLSETTFYSLQEYGRVNVVFGEAGRVERLDWEWNGAFQPWRRTGEAED
jgi:CubicO group peptidase (beta-lactamase class C family)